MGGKFKLFKIAPTLKFSKILMHPVLADTEPKSKNAKILLFYLEPNNHWSNLLIILKQQVMSICSCMHKNWIIVNVDTEVEHRIVQQILIRERINYRSFLLENEKKLKYVLRGLPAKVEVLLIHKALSAAELTGLTVTQMYGVTQKIVSLSF